MISPVPAAQEFVTIPRLSPGDMHFIRGNSKDCQMALCRHTLKVKQLREVITWHR